VNALRLFVPLLLCLLLGACVSKSVKCTSVPNIQGAAREIPEELLLDVGIEIFDPGLDNYDDDDLVYPEVRRAEARYMPNLLSQAMEQSGAWGAVRVVPGDGQITDLVIRGEILHSDGEELALHIDAIDSRGYVWLDRNYRAQASRYAYQNTTRYKQDPFQAVYNTIANDLLQQMETLRPQDLRSLRLVSELRFAQSFSPEAFEGYLDLNPSDKYLVMRLPARDDPMLERVRKIRERDHLFVDTLQGYYDEFDQQMAGPYQEWRKLSYEEALALQQLRADSRRRLIAGGAAILAGIIGAASDDPYARSAGSVAVVGGGYLLKSGLQKRAEAEIHVEALEEMGMSLEAEITPQVIELEDRTVTLSGNVQEQYAQWRTLLLEIYQAEMGNLAMPEDTAAAPDTL